jgi:hypothetical protein
MTIFKSYKSCSDNLDAQGGRGKMHQLFGDRMNENVGKLNEILAA